MKINRTIWLLAIAAVLATAAYFDQASGPASTRDVSVPAAMRAQPPASTTAAQGKPAIPSGPQAASLAHPLAEVRLQDLRDTLARPLFEASRRPIVPPPAVAPSTPPAAKAPESVPAPPAFRLVGVISGFGQTTALLIVPGQRQTMRVEQGDTVDGWHIRRIALDGITLDRNGQQIVVNSARQKGR